MRNDPRLKQPELQPRDHALIELGEAAHDLESIKATGPILAVLRRVMGRLLKIASLLTDEDKADKEKSVWPKRSY